MSIAQQDRADVKAMHALANGTSSAASNMSKKRSHDRLESKSPWGDKPATIIPKPGTQPYASGSKQSKNSRTDNPFSKANFNNLNMSQTPKPVPPSRQNPNARTVISNVSSAVAKPKQARPDRQPAAKKQRLESMDARSSTAAPARNSATTSKESQNRSHSPTSSASITPAFQEMDLASLDRSHSRSANSGMLTAQSAKSKRDDPFTISTPSSRSEVIDVDQDEDLGERVTHNDPTSFPLTPSNSSDDLQFIPRHRHDDRDLGKQTIGSILGVSVPTDGHEFDREQTENGPIPSFSAAPHTRALKASLDRGRDNWATNSGETADDPIEDADDLTNMPSTSRPHTPKSSHRKRKSAPSGATEIPKNLVRNTVSSIESRTAPPPEVDLVARYKSTRGGASRVATMKPKKEDLVDRAPVPLHSLDKPPRSMRRNNIASRAQAPPASVPMTEFIRGDNSNDRQREPPLVLPLEAYACGTKIYDSVDAEDPQPKHWLRVRDGFVAIVNAPVENGTAIVELNVDNDILNFEIPSKDHDVRKFPLVVIKLRETDRNQKFIQRTAGFGFDLIPVIMIKPLMSHPNWSVTNFNKLKGAIKMLRPSIAYLGANAFSSRWEHLKHLDLSPSDQPPSRMSAQGAKRRPQPKPDYGGATDSNSWNQEGSGSSSIFDNQRTRRSARQLTVTAARVSNPNRSPSPPADEIILLYPATGTGAVNVTNGDLKRLQPGEYLNDTLIEFGLKLWLHDLRTQRPEFADQVHVFSSFFYTQLNQKSIEEGYQSVRKWTSKFDLFKKKYIIVPINEHLHWYLAIICHPERTLQQPVPAPVVTPNVITRIKARKPETTRTGLQRLSPSPGHPNAIRPPSSKDTAASARSTVEDEQEVEWAVHVFHDTPQPDVSIPSRPASRSSSLSSLSTAEADLNVKPASNSNLEEIISTTESEGEDDPVPMDVVMESRPPSPRLGPARFHEADSRHTAIPSRDFYAAPALAKPNLHNGILQLTSDEEGEQEVDELEGDDPMDVDMPTPQSAFEQTGPDAPYIFSFDSLGARHPHALKVLSRYLDMEAKDKKGWTDAVQAVTKQASVPAQPNYCDCGVYLLHFVEQFMSDPEAFSQQIMQHNKSKKSSDSNKLDRERLWSHDRVAGRREEMKQKILTLSADWMQEKQVDCKGKGKGKDKTEVEPSKVPAESVDDDSDIEVLEMTPEPSKASKATRSQGMHKAARIR